MSKIYTVFVDGVEVNDYYLSLNSAIELHETYTNDGYDPYIHKTIFDTEGNVKEYIHVPTDLDKVYS